MSYSLSGSQTSHWSDPKTQDVPFSQHHERPRHQSAKYNIHSAKPHLRNRQKIRSLPNVLATHWPDGSGTPGLRGKVPDSSDRPVSDYPFPVL